MKIVRVCGGFGNQIFQYAFYQAIKAKFNQETVKLDIHDMASYQLHNGFELERIFNLNENYCSKEEKLQIQGTKNIVTKFKKELNKYLPFVNRTYIKEKKKLHFSYQEQFLGTANTNVYYRGSWQSYRYLDNIESTLRENLVFPSFTEQQNIELADDIANHTTVAIHIRRGDYLKHKSLGGICTTDYYEQAVKKIESLVENPMFVVFSDDIPWCRENLKVANAKFVDWNGGENSYRDMQLMSLCNHNIIANSSFSWWGAWLNANPNKIVVCPGKWIHYTDSLGILPKEWLVIPTTS
ncbi:alpha-1,2-fucosyltransferase [Thalassotalea sp. PLHSN55]|uniref:alpha-1,2-fucosyltransferase n=1 Tax=Thalassotalea sp. PLHSN55 TaxID=3435888 RepID=UPI003F87026C